jgi:hypothetical protein
MALLRVSCEYDGLYFWVAYDVSLDETRWDFGVVVDDHQWGGWLEKSFLVCAEAADVDVWDLPHPVGSKL